MPKVRVPDFLFMIGLAIISFLLNHNAYSTAIVWVPFTVWGCVGSICLRLEDLKN